MSIQNFSERIIPQVVVDKRRLNAKGAIPKGIQAWQARQVKEHYSSPRLPQTYASTP